MAESLIMAESDSLMDASSERALCRLRCVSQTLLTNTEIQRRLIEELPLLRAFKPFKDLADKGKAATGEEVQPPHIPYLLGSDYSISISQKLADLERVVCGVVADGGRVRRGHEGHLRLHEGRHRQDQGTV